MDKPTSALAELLQVYGGWGLCAVLIGVVGLLARHIKHLNESIIESNKEHNAKLLELLERRIESDIKHTQTFENLKSVIEILISKL